MTNPSWYPAKEEDIISCEAFSKSMLESYVLAV